MGYNYRDQWDVIKSIRIREGEKKTLDCPFCGGKKKFTIDRFDGKLVWNCFRASCSVKGAHTGERNIDATKAYLSGNKNTKAKTKHVPLPNITSRPENHPLVISYLESVNSLGAYKKGFIRVRYAPSENRVLFYNSDNTGAVGRSLVPSRYKWWNYGDLTAGIHVGDGEHAILVEDAPSACAVSNVEGLTGVAMLGTTLTSALRMSLNKYTKVTIVLDNDASKKALSITRKYDQIDCIRLTKKDLKWLSTKQIQNLLR